jgi:hypothetical protein
MVVGKADKLRKFGGWQRQLTDWEPLQVFFGFLLPLGYTGHIIVKT